MNNSNNTEFNPDDGEFMAERRTLPDVVVWRICDHMCITDERDPIYITKKQAMKFFNLQEVI